jgi:hypothetical protein
LKTISLIATPADFSVKHMNSSSCSAAKVICYLTTLAVYLYLSISWVTNPPPAASHDANEKGLLLGCKINDLPYSSALLCPCCKNSSHFWQAARYQSMHAQFKKLNGTLLGRCIVAA